MRKVYWLLLCILLSITKLGWTQQAPVELTVFAAASLADVMTDVAQEFEKTHDVKVYINLAGSSTLRIQIEKGGPCDIFVSANPEHVQRLIDQGLVDPNQTRGIAGNELVVIAHKDNPATMNDISDLVFLVNDFLSLANTEEVPAGIYAKQALQKAGIWEKLKERVAPALDVRAAMSYVENGNAALGIVYKTDVAASKKVKVIYEIPKDFSPQIQYVACIIKGSTNSLIAQQFLLFLVSDMSKKIFTKYGFAIL